MVILDRLAREGLDKKVWSPPKRIKFYRGTFFFFRVFIAHCSPRMEQNFFVDTNAVLADGKE